MHQYARHLKERIVEGELAGSTANTYWNYIAAFLSWCVYEELVAENSVRNAEPKRNSPTSDLEAIVNSSGAETIEQPSSHISTSERIPPSTSKG